VSHESQPSFVGHDAENSTSIDSKGKTLSTVDIVKTIVKMSSSNPTDFFCRREFREIILQCAKEMRKRRCFARAMARYRLALRQIICLPAQLCPRNYAHG
jgi:hypothetical protein